MPIYRTDEQALAEVMAINYETDRYPNTELAVFLVVQALRAAIRRIEKLEKADADR